MAARTLAEMARGARARVIATSGEAAAHLAAQGIHPGAMLTVEQDAPFRGPRIVRLGPARIAIARSVAAAIQVLPERP